MESKDKTDSNTALQEPSSALPPALATASRHAALWLAGLPHRSVAATVGAEELQRRLSAEMPTQGLAATAVIDELVQVTEGGHIGSASGRFFAWVIGGALESALAADWLTSVWDQNAALAGSGPAAAEVEAVAGRWLKQLLGLPAEASFAFTNGCQLAHVTALAAARHALLHQLGWDVEADGLFGAPRLRVICGAERHVSIDRALRFLGFGRRVLQLVAVDAQGQVSCAALQQALAAEDTPAIVVLNAADLHVAAFDPFATLIPMAQQAGAWVHVDGAFGLFAYASAQHRHLVAGVELADSWASDCHKWLNVPFDSGFVAIRDRVSHRAAMTIAADYVAPSAQRDPIDWNLEWSRRGRGFAVYAALRELGQQGVADLVSRCCCHCLALVEGIAALPGAQMVSRPQLNQGLLRFLDLRPGANAAAHDARTDAVIAATNATGEAFFSPSTWQRQRVMRVSVVNWRTDAASVQRAVAAVAAVLQAL